MKRRLLALLLCLSMLLLAGCKAREQQHFDYFPNTGAQMEVQNQPTDAPTDVSQPAEDEIPLPGAPGGYNYDDGDYDPSREEGLGADDLLDLFDAETPTPVLTIAPTVYSQYAGATPVRIDPIDKPTATVVPPLTFTYQPYEATSLGLTFEGPMGWVPDESIPDTYILYNPDPTMAYRATLTITVTPVTTKYEENDLAQEIKSRLNTIKSSGFTSWSPSNTAPRNLLGYPGVYANYTGVIDGEEVAGRVHITYFSNMLYFMHVTYPKAYTDTYKDGVYDKVRNTIKQIGQ